MKNTNEPKIWTAEEQAENKMYPVVIGMTPWLRARTLSNLRLSDPTGVSCRQRHDAQLVAIAEAEAKENREENQ